MVRLGELLFSMPVISAVRVEAMLGVTRPTAHAAIGALVERGDLREVTGRQRGRIYEAPRIYRAVYGPLDVTGAVRRDRSSPDLDPRRDHG